MSTIDRAALAQYLSEEVERLQAALAYHETTNSHTNQLNGDDADLSAALQGQIEAQAVIEYRRELLAQIQAARQCLADGSYGTCEACGRSIPTERLEIIPYTTLCVACQSERERNQ